MPDRRSLSPRQRLDVLHAAGGICYLCGKPINLARAKRGEAEGFEVEHVHQIAMGGADDPSNWRPAHPSCHRKKSRKDAAARAKVRRAEKKAAGVVKPKRKIVSRGFDTRFTRKITGETVRRE